MITAAEAKRFAVAGDGSETPSGPIGHFMVVRPWRQLKQLLQSRPHLLRLDKLEGSSD